MRIEYNKNFGYDLPYPFTGRFSFYDYCIALEKIGIHVTQIVVVEGISIFRPEGKDETK